MLCCFVCWCDVLFCVVLFCVVLFCPTKLPTTRLLPKELSLTCRFCSWIWILEAFLFWSSHSYFEVSPFLDWRFYYELIRHSSVTAFGYQMNQMILEHLLLQSWPFSAAMGPEIEGLRALRKKGCEAPLPPASRHPPLMSLWSSKTLLGLEGPLKSLIWSNSDSFRGF